MSSHSLAFLLQKVLVSVVEVKINKKDRGEKESIKYLYSFNTALNIFNIALNIAIYSQNILQYSQTHIMFIHNLNYNYICIISNLIPINIYQS